VRSQAQLVKQLRVYDARVSTNAAEVAVKFEFRKMRDEDAQQDAQQIAGWRYDPPYDFYNAVSDQDDLAELLDPRRRGDDYFSASDEKGARGLLAGRARLRAVVLFLEHFPPVGGYLQRESHQGVRGRKLRPRADLPPRDQRRGARVPGAGAARVSRPNHATPELIALDGVGPDTAAALPNAAGDNPQRLKRAKPLSFRSPVRGGARPGLLGQDGEAPSQPRRQPRRR
jgi:hypothetical protein